MSEQQERVVVAYDSALAPLCGGVAPALLMCYFETVFRENGYPPAGIRRQNLTAWRTGLGYKTPQPWFRHFYRIGVLHQGAQIYRAAVRAQREFVSPDLSRYVFYAMELTRPGVGATLHRNAPLIDSLFARIDGATGPAPSVSEHVGAYVAAKRDAAEFIKRLGGDVGEFRLLAEP